MAVAVPIGVAADAYIAEQNDETPHIVACKNPEELGFSNRGSSVNSILVAVPAWTMVLFVIGACPSHHGVR